MRTTLILLLLTALASCSFLGFARDEDGAPMVHEDALESAVLVLDALATGQDELAGSILRRMRAFHPDRGTQDWIDGLELVLEGRRLIGSIELSLLVRTEDVDGARVRNLVMRASAKGQQDIELFMAPPTLRCRRTWIDPLGNGGSSDDSVGLDWLESLVLPGDETVEFTIMRLEGGRGGAASMREHWELDMRFCYLVQNDKRFLVNAPFVQGIDRYLLSTSLTLGDLDVGPYLDVLWGTKPPQMQQLVERAVRIPEGRKAAAMDRIAPRIAELSITRLELAAASLAWIAGGTGYTFFEPGSVFERLAAAEQDLPIVSDGQLLAPELLRGNGHAWKRWAEAWIQMRGRKSQSNLDVPGYVSDASAPQLK